MSVSSSLPALLRRALPPVRARRSRRRRRRGGAQFPADRRRVPRTDAVSRRRASGVRRHAGAHQPRGPVGRRGAARRRCAARDLPGDRAAAGEIPVDGGTIGNTSFVAIPCNAAHKEAGMVVADSLLEPATQARAQDIRQTGSLTVLDLAKLAPADRARFDALPRSPAWPTTAALGAPLPEPHPSWTTRITADWERRHTR